MTNIIIVMGVSGCGKSSVAQALAHEVGAEYIDADDYHPATNIDKMQRGVPLTDLDRASWLAVISSLLKARSANKRRIILACSALKESYRRNLRVSPGVQFLYLQGSFEVIKARLLARPRHFMKVEMLESQFQTLEEPEYGPGTDCWTADVTLPIETIVDRAVDHFELRRNP